MSSTQYTTAYGNFYNFCRDSTLPVCNLYRQGQIKGGPGYNTGPQNRCDLVGISLSGGRHLSNLGVILLDGAAMLTVLILLLLTQRRKAAVGRREIQLFLLGYFILSLCELFTIGGFPLGSNIRIAFTGIQLGIFTATTWMLMINGAVGFQAIDDGSFLSIFLLFASTAAIFIGTGYIALDTGYDWSGYWNGPAVQFNPDRQYSLYTLIILAPLVFLFIYLVLSTFLVTTVLGEKKPLVFLYTAALLFAIGQVFNYVISIHICSGTSGAVDGSLFQTFFTLLSVIMVWVYWTSITEQDWPAINQGDSAYAT